MARAAIIPRFMPNSPRSRFRALFLSAILSTSPRTGLTPSDPELGGATFSNFNVDAIQEVQANSGVMNAEIGHGAASFTNVVTKSGTDQIHGSLFEFVRNAAFDARNYFDYKEPTGLEVDPVAGSPTAPSGSLATHARSALFGSVAVSLRVQQTAADSRPDP